MPKHLVIYGARYPDIVKLVLAINRVSEDWDIKGFIDDSLHGEGLSFMGYPILGNRECIGSFDPESTYFINNVCTNMWARQKVTHVLHDNGCRFATLVHPDVDTTFAHIGEGTIIADGAIVGSNVTIGKHCAIRFNAVINHDNILDDHIFVGPGATMSGHISVGPGAYLGAGCTIKERIIIERNSIVGAGAVVLKDVKSNTIVAGVPARELEIPAST